MDASEALRTARRRAGISQRELALRAGVSASAVGAYESGARSPSVAVLGRLVDVAGLEVALVRRLPPPCRHVRPYLRLAPVVRLKLALGGHPSLADRSPPGRWTQLWDLASTGRVALVGTAAVGVWVPGVLTAAVTVTVEPGRGNAVPGAREAAVDLEVVPVDATGTVARPTVPIAYRARRVLVPTPGELALDPACAAWRTPLAVAARVLHEDRARDDGDRRAPAHRDPEHETERIRDLQTSRFRRMPWPRDDRVRSWRLGSAVGYDQWLRSLGYPVGE